MGLWFFLTVVIVGNLSFKAYKLRFLKANTTDRELEDLKKEVKKLREELAAERFKERLTQLEEAVFFGDFELKQKFNALEKEMQKQVNRN